ncbi:hypothetical protein TNCV_815691 [Trichonephila clavipes]|nr:hypothetical protein TNCV_815691 [Trichonephila clavipes]
MFDPSSFANPTPLAHADTSRDVLPRGGTSQYLTRIYQPKSSRCFLQGLGCVQLFVDQNHVRLRRTNLFHEVDDITTEKFCDPAFVDQETGHDTFVDQLCRYHLHSRRCLLRSIRKVSHRSPIANTAFLY